MALTSIERVRLKISDKPRLNRERFQADGASDRFKLKFNPVQQTPAPEVWLGGVLQVEGTDYTVDYEYGIIIFAVGPSVNTDLVFQYYSVIWTDEEVQDFLDQHSDNTIVASAHILYAWAADRAKLAQRRTLSGGGGVGAITEDTSVAARELRNAADSLLEWEKEFGEELGTAVPAEGITEVPWTEAAFEQGEAQRFLREN